jgi:transposase-like protein
VGAIEDELGLSHNLLRQWKKRYQVNAVTDGLERSEVEELKAELRQAKRELDITRQERDILKTQCRYSPRISIHEIPCSCRL